MQIHGIPLDQIQIKNRQRKEFSYEQITELANSISRQGILHPPVIRTDPDGGYVLVAGERRIRAMVYVWAFGNTVRCGTSSYAEDVVPCLMLGEIDPIDAFELELEENIRREDLTWQEKATATSQLYQLRRSQAKAAGEDMPTVADIAQEVRGDSNYAQETTRAELLIANSLSDPDIAGAKSASDALKVLKRKEDARRMVALGESVGQTFTSAIHDLRQGNCLEILPLLPLESVDVILTDPPYGMGADSFGDSGGRTPGSHFYDDSLEHWASLIQTCASEFYRVAKVQAHAYVFCDIQQFPALGEYMRAAGWKVFRTPLIWINPSGMRAPWPDQGPQRKYQTCLYAVKGSRNVTRLYPDTVSYPSDANLNHPAQKPVALYQDFLRRSVRPGDTVLDPFCGTGTIFPAAHELKCKAMGIELDSAAYGIAVRRIQELG